MSIDLYKVLLILTILTVSLNLNNAEAYESIDDSWKSYFEGSNYNNIFQTINSNENGFISVGLTNSFNTSGTDIWLVKINEKGSMTWHRYFGLKDNDIGFSVVETNDSNYIVVGYLTIENNNQESCALKINTTGDLEWFETYGFEYNDQATFVVNDNDDYVLSGFFGNSEHYTDAYLLKINPDGEKVFIKTYGGE
jgi:hypothetical protein